jgi:sterol desaturase/sphingolipid hydroxylase (fatty acid hydroxylase superfamily)
MTLSALALSSLGTMGLILLTMSILACVELAIPLHARGRWHRAHLGPNLALTLLTFATNDVFNVALVMALTRLHSSQFGLLHGLALAAPTADIVAVLALDFSFYVAHRAMHWIPGFWRFHRVHHCDPAVDVTTTIRQHPGESVIRYVFLSAFAIALGVSPSAFAVYRVWSVLSGLLEHSNIRMPRWLDGLFSLVITTPNLHKIHHSRSVEESDTNYGNITSLWDRALRSFTPSLRGMSVVCGLDGFDAPALQTTAGLLGMPFLNVEEASGAPARGAALKFVLQDSQPDIPKR